MSGGATGLRREAGNPALRRPEKVLCKLTPEEWAGIVR